MHLLHFDFFFKFTFEFQFSFCKEIRVFIKNGVGLWPQIQPTLLKYIRVLLYRLNLSRFILSVEGRKQMITMRECFGRS